jgi:hypothetical protein
LSGTVPWQLYRNRYWRSLAVQAAPVALRPELHSRSCSSWRIGGGGEVSRDSNVGFLCNFKRVVDLDAEVPDRALDLGMAK